MSSIVSTPSPSRSSGRLRSDIHSQGHGSKLKPSCLLLKNQNFPFPKEKIYFHIAVRKNMAIHSGDPLGTSPPPPPAADPSSPPWKFWVVGVLISVILPFWKNKWWPLLLLKQNVDKVVDVVEDVAEVVETVAEGVEKVAEDVAEHLPEGGDLQKAAIFVENVARTAAGDADLVGDFIDKVQEMEDDVVSFIKEEAGRENGERLEEKAKPKPKDEHNVKESTAETKRELISEEAVLKETTKEKE